MRPWAALPSPGFVRLPVMQLGRFSRRVGAFALLAFCGLLALAPIAMAADGVGTYGRTNDKVVTFFAFGLSIDPVDAHAKWSADIEETQGAKVTYPMIGDTDLAVAKLYNMLPAEEAGTSDGRTAATNATVRSVFVIGPDKKIKLMLTYPMTTGRNFDEILRVVDSMQLTAKYKVATPVKWKKGDDVIIAGSVSDEDAKTLFPAGWKAPKPYLRVTKQPG